jgi:hypothetical protein
MNDDEIHDAMLSERLRRAAMVDVRPDLADVEFRSRRIHARRRTAVGISAAVLVAGAGGIGFGVGHRLADGDEEVVTGAAASPDDVALTVANESPTTTTVLIPAPVPANVVAEAGGAPVSATSVNTGYGRAGSPVFAADLTYTVISDRTTDAGLRVRALQSGPWEPYRMEPKEAEEAGAPAGWQPAAWCAPAGELRVAVAGPDVIDVGGASWYSELAGDVMVSQVFLGWVDGSDVLALVVQAAPAITEVAATFDGATDSVPVTDGIAVLAMPAADLSGPIDDDRLQVTVTSDGTTRTLTHDELFPYETMAWHEACTPPPPALPPAGEQPADAESAEAEIRDRFDLLWDRTVPAEDKPADLLDDRTGVDDARAALDEGQFGEIAETAVHVIEDFVFTSPTEAWFRYRIETDNGIFGERYGTVSLIDGSWRFARAVLCQDLALAAAPCEPDVMPIYPPSAVDGSMGSGSAGACTTTPDGEVCTAESSSVEDPSDD